VPAEVRALASGEAEIRFDEPVRAVAPGQAAVFYDEANDDEVIGGGFLVEGRR
jgi:tRNA-specific 2-thiouridylase